MNLTKIQKILKFKQSDRLKKCIDLNTAKEKMLLIVLKVFFKLMINSIYGKTMGNLKQRINFRLVNHEKDYLKHVN